MALLALLATLWQFEATYDVRSYAGAVRIPMVGTALGVGVFGAASDSDPLTQEDFLAPEFMWFVSPTCSLRAQLARALRPGSDDQLSLSLTWQF